MLWNDLLCQKPEPGEYPAYAEMYMSHIPSGSCLRDILQTNQKAVVELISSMPDHALRFRLRPEAWTIKEIVNHITDDERIYCYRALRFARADGTELPGFDQNLFVDHARSNERPSDDLLDEFVSVRQATLCLFRSLDGTSLLRTGVADGNRYSVRGLGFHLAGHAMHHLDLIRRVYAPPAMQA